MPSPISSSRLLKPFLVLLLVASCAANAPDPAADATPASEAASNAAQTTQGSTVVATWDGGSATYSEISGEVEGQLSQLKAEYETNKYQLEVQALEQFVVNALLEAEAKKAGHADVNALIAAEVESKVTPPTEKEIEEFYEVMKRQMRGRSLEEVAPMVASELLRRKQLEQFTTYVDALREKHNVKVTLPYPELPRVTVSADDDPSIGPEDAPIQIIQFAEFQCPYCGKAGPTIDQVMKEYEGKVRMVYRDFPLSFHDKAITAAVAANCTIEQGKYWEMHKLLMDNQRDLDEASLTAHAVSLSLDMDKWNTCRQDPAQVTEVEKDMADGAAVGVSGTPAFFVNGIMLSGAQPFEEFKKIIDRELEG